MAAPSPKVRASTSQSQPIGEGEPEQASDSARREKSSEGIFGQQHQSKAQVLKKSLSRKTSNDDGCKIKPKVSKENEVTQLLKLASKRLEADSSESFGRQRRRKSSDAQKKSFLGKNQNEDDSESARLVRVDRNENHQQIKDVSEATQAELLQQKESFLQSLGLSQSNS